MLVFGDNGPFCSSERLAAPVLSTVANATAVLDLFTTEAPEHGVSDVARALRMPKSRAHALLTSLAAGGLLRRTEDRRYRLGWRILDMHHVLTETTDFKAQARAVMAHVQAQSSQVVHLATLDGGQIRYVDKLEAQGAPRVEASRVGGRLPAHCTAVGKVLLAQLPAPEIEEIVDCQGLQRFTARTIVTPGALAAELEEVRRQGFARDRGEVEEQLACLAAPIYDTTGRAIAAISISAPAARMARHEAAFRQLITKAGRGVTSRLCGAGALRCR